MEFAGDNVIGEISNRRNGQEMKEFWGKEKGRERERERVK
jgi:hypothetical protein